MPDAAAFPLRKVLCSYSEFVSVVEGLVNAGNYFELQRCAVIETGVADILADIGHEFLHVEVVKEILVGDDCVLTW